MKRLTLWLLMCLVVPTAAEALPITTIVSVQQHVVGNAVVNLQLPEVGVPQIAGGFDVSVVLPEGDLFSSAQVIIDFLVEDDDPVNLLFMTGYLWGRDLGGCFGSCDPLQNVNVSLLQLSPDPAVLSSLYPSVFIDTFDLVRAEPGLFRYVLDISQLGGNGEARLWTAVEIAIPEPSAILVFSLGLGVVGGVVRRSPSPTVSG